MNHSILGLFLLVSVSIRPILNSSCDASCKTCSTIGITTCLTCMKGYYLSSNNCLMCPQECLQCSDSRTCLNCTAKYFLKKQNSQNSCVPCMDGCLKCENITKCLICLLQYYVDQKSSQCMKCSNNCIKCSNSTSCTTCTVGYYSLKGQCKPCSINCLQCKNQSNCQLCEQNYYPQRITNNSNWQCASCPTCSKCKIEKNCLRCDTTIICDSECVNSYLLKRSCLNTQSKSYKLIIGIAISSFIFICVLLLALCKSRKRNQLSDVSLSQSNAQWQTSLRQLSDVLTFLQSKNGDQDLDFISECSVCQQKGVNVCTPCKHMFHMHCLTLWTKKKKNCPNCRSTSIKVMKIYCKMCHRYYVVKELKHCQLLRNSSSLDICDFCKAI